MPPELPAAHPVEDEVQPQEDAAAGGEGGVANAAQAVVCAAPARAPPPSAALPQLRTNMAVPSANRAAAPRCAVQCCAAHIGFHTTR